MVFNFLIIILYLKLILLGNTKKNFIKKKPTYFNCGYVQKSNFFPYLRNLIDKKYNLIPYMKKRNLAVKDLGKFEKNMQKFQSLIIQSDPEDLTLSNSMLKSNLYKNLTLKNKFNDPTKLDDESNIYNKIFLFLKFEY